MPTILFTFRENTSEGLRETVIDHLRRTEGIKAAGRVRPDASLSSLRRMGFAEVAGEEALAHASEWLSSAPEVESVEVPAPRGIAAYQ